MTPITKYPLRTTGVFLILLFAGYGIFEYAVFHTSEERSDVEKIIRYSLDEASAFFFEVYSDFEQTSHQMFETIEQAVTTNQGRMSIHSRVSQTDLWGLTIYKNGDRWYWHDYTLIPREQSGQYSRVNGDTISIVNLNNVNVLHHQHTFEHEDDIYTVITARRISQSTDLPYIRDVEYQLSDEPRLRDNYPVHFNFFGTVPGDAFYKPLYSPQADTLGTVYATLNYATRYFQSQEEYLYLWRMLFHCLLFISLLTGLILAAFIRKSIRFHLFLLPLILVLWPIVLQTGILDYWITLYLAVADAPDPDTVFQLARYITNALFLLFLFVCFFNLLKLTQKPQRNDKHFRTFALSSLFGALNVLLSLFFVYSTQNLLTDSNIPLLDLELAPDAHSFIFYIFSGVFLAATSGICLSAGYYLYISEVDKSGFIALISLFSFVCIYFVLDLVAVENLFINWTFIITTSLFLTYLIAIQVLYKNPDRLFTMSGFRKLMIAVLVISTSIYVMIWNSNNKRMDQDLLSQIETYTDEDAINTRDILYQLLSDLEQDLSMFTAEDITVRPGVVQSEFQRSIQNNIRTEWKNHSFHIKLLSSGGDELTTYSTALETPAWASFYSTETMLSSYRGERINRQTNRPVIWLRPTISERYTVLERGWIPVYDSEQLGVIIAWIAGDVYKERLDYNKPMRAVLSAATSRDWKQSYYIAEYRGERLSASTVRGIYRNQPQYNKLPRREVEIARQDSINFITNITSDGMFREVFVRPDDQRILKASTPVPGFNHHLFSYFRLQIVLIFFGLFCFSILAMCGLEHYSLFGQNRRFKDRLIDGLSLATILFLIVLIFATQYAVDIQNEKSGERDLVNSLSGITESLKDQDIFSENTDITEVLSEITTSLNVDLILYKGPNVYVTTTPQIFQQYLVPASIPYTVFDFLFNRERSHYVTSTEIGNEEMLIGYRTLSDTDGFPVGAIAIPTFLQSPVYNEQLLETTSYLLVVYLFIFAIFIMGSVFLSNQLTKPLKHIQVGLHHISRGDMKTKVPVTSRDEIGSLAHAYNTMVRQLDHAQKELMKAERESAWKEMAQQVAHEIKNPLTPMKLNLQHLQRQIESNPDKAFELKPIVERTASNIIEQIESLNKIASDFSKFAKPIEEPRERIDLPLLTDSVVGLYEHDDSVTIRLNLPDKKTTVLAVEDELRRALINLIKNGIEATNPPRALLEITVKNNRDHALIQIRDHGNGIAETDREKIFLPRFSTKSSGTGLGLAITKKIIEEHNGEIWFESKQGEGTSFYIRLPLS